MIKLREICAVAKMDDELFALLMQPETREHLRTVLINTYFAPESRVAGGFVHISFALIAKNFALKAKHDHESSIHYLRIILSQIGYDFDEIWKKLGK